MERQPKALILFASALILLTNAMAQVQPANMPPNTILGNPDPVRSGPGQGITLGSGCSIAGGVLNCTGSGGGGSLPASATLLGTNSGGTAIAAPLTSGHVFYGVGGLPVDTSLAAAGIVAGAGNLGTGGNPGPVPYVSAAGVLREDTTVGPYIDATNHRVGVKTSAPGSTFSVGSVNVPGGDFQVDPNYVYGTAGAQNGILTYYGGLYLGAAAGDPSFGIDVNALGDGTNGTRILSYNELAYCFTVDYPVIDCTTRFTSDGNVLAKGYFYGIQSNTIPSVVGCSASISVGSTSVAGGVVSGTTGACTVTVTLPGSGFPHGPVFTAYNITHPGNPIQITGTTIGSITFTGTTTSGDVILYGGVGF